MTPYYEDGAVTIYHGDCREMVWSLQFDALVTDPPYGLGDRWTGGTWGAAAMYDDARQWDVRPDNELVRGMVSQARESIVWGGNYFEMPPSRCWLAWFKIPSMATMADMELAWTSFDRPAKSITESRNPDGTREHPTQKPLRVMRWCIEMLDDLSVVVLDPFAGSGTTLRAAKDCGRKAIGIELSERYCEIAARRCAQEVLAL